MSKLLKKAAGKLEDYAVSRTSSGSGGGAASSSAPPPSTPLDALPSRRDILLHRQQRGVNLGSLFALEPWLTPSLFEGVANADSEMDLLRALPAAEARERLERHWRGFLDAGDWEWMREHGINTVRLPLLYVHFCASQAPQLLRHTEYAPYVDVYAGAWAHVERVLAQAAQHDIGVLVDLHGAPGAQNADGHSGLSGAEVQLWDGHAASQNQTRTVEILVALASSLAPHEHVVGLELLNEPRNGATLQAFYERAAGAIRGAGVHMPLYLADGWDAPHYAQLVARREDFCVLDTHVYRCFTKDDHSHSASSHARSMRPGGASHGMLSHWGAAAQRSLVVGEWSAALNPASLRNCGDAKEAQREYAHAQLALFEETCAGAYFWTLKKEGGADPGWCLYTAIEQGILPSSLHPLASASAPSAEVLLRARHAAHEAHRTYWAAHGAGDGAHEAFAEGFAQATKDAAAFWQCDRSTVGFTQQWTRTRTQAYEKAKRSSNEWEYAHGFAQGIGAFKDALK